MKSVAIVVTALFIAATGSAVAADGDQAREQLMQQQREQVQERVGANGEKYQEYAKQKREQMQNRYQYRNQIREGSGARMQERMTHRKG
jgi:cytochrome c556